MTAWGCRWVSATPSAMTPPLSTPSALTPPPPHTHTLRMRTPLPPLRPARCKQAAAPLPPLCAFATRGAGGPSPLLPCLHHPAAPGAHARCCGGGGGGVGRGGRACAGGAAAAWSGSGGRAAEGPGRAAPGRAVRDGRGRADHAEDPHHRRERRRQVQVRGCQRFPAGHEARGRRAGRPASGRGLPLARPGPASFRPGPAGGAEALKALAGGSRPPSRPWV